MMLHVLFHLGYIGHLISICLLLSTKTYWFLCFLRRDIVSVLLQLLNQIVCELPPEHPVAVANVRPLRDSLGHTPLQV